MRSLSREGSSAEVVRIGDRFRKRWKGNARFYGLLVDACRGLSLWGETIRFGRMALALHPRQLTTVYFMLSAYRSLDCSRGIAFGEAWLARHGADGEACRHLSLIYDDLGRPADALSVARRGLAVARGNRRLVACTANYLAKVEGAANALRFAETHREVFSNDTYCEETLANGLVVCGALSEAAAMFESLYRRNPHDAEILALLLDVWFRTGNCREIMAAVDEWRDRKAVTATMANEAGRACLELGRDEEALDWFGRAIELDPDSEKYADNHAISLGRVGRYAESIEAAQRRLSAPGKPDRYRLLRSIAVNHTFLGQHEQALRFYEAAHAESPEKPDGIVDKIVSLNWMSRYAESADFGLSHRTTLGATLSQRYWSELTWALHNVGRFAEEEDLAQEWARLHPADVLVVRAMKRARNALQRPDEALAFARDWAGAHPNEPWGWRYLAEQHERCGDPAAEIAAIAEACRLAPDSADFIDAHIVILRRLARPQDAFDAGSSWMASHAPGATGALLNRIGLAADDLEHWHAAEEYYRRAHQMEPACGTWVGNLARALIFLQRADDAAALLRQWLADHPWDNYVAARLAWSLRTAGLLAEERSVLRRIADSDSDNADVPQDLLTNLIAQNLTEEGHAWIAHCDSAAKADSRMYNEWGNHLRNTARLEEANTAYRRALELKPDNEIAAGNLASLLLHQGRAAEALRLCRDWLDKRPDDAYVRRQFTHAAYSSDEYSLAEPEYRALFAREPDSTFLLERRVACLRLLGRFDEALDTANQWLATHRGTAFLLIEMGISAQRLGRPDLALTHIDAALQLDPASCAAALRKLRLLGGKDLLDRALEFGEEWCNAHPAAADGDFHNDLAILHDRAGRTAGAEQSFLKAMASDPNNATFAGNGVNILARNNKLTESIQLGQRFLANGPPNAYLLQRLAESYACHHEYEPALDLLVGADTLEPANEDVARAFLRIVWEGGELHRGIEFGRAWLARPENERRASIWAWFARICFRADLDDEAFAANRRAALLEPDEIAHIRQRFSFWNALQDDRTLVKEYEELRHDWNDDAQVLRYTSRAYHDLGMSSEALDLATRNLGVNPGDHEACAWLADLLDRSGRSEEAVECLRRWINIHGGQPAVLKVRARLALRGMNFSDALADAEKVLTSDATDVDSFVLTIQALHGLRRGPDAKARLHHWIEHHGTSPRIEQLLDENSEAGTP